MESYTLFLSEKGFDTPLWILDLNNTELLAGMLAAGIGILDDLNNEDNNTQIFYLDSDADVSSFRLISDIFEEDVRPNTLNKLIDGQYGIWLKGSKPYHYNLYAFKTNNFFQGIVSICNAFQVDFRNYIYGFPFDKYGNQYSLSDYVMAPYQITQDAPDLDDIEEEERDNENIIEALARTDDIVVLT